MTCDELIKLARSLPLNAPEMGLTHHLAGLSRNVGKLTGAVEAWAATPGDLGIVQAIAGPGGAVILLVVAILEKHGVSLDQAVQAGLQEIAE